MDSKYRTVTVTWQSRRAAGWNRLSLSRFAVVFWASLFLCFSVSALVLGAVTAYVCTENADLTARAAALGAENRALEERLGFFKAENRTLGERLRALEGEISATREALARVRAEETKIRSWLGLEEEAGEGSLEPDEAEGGQGSLGDVDLDAVAPRERVTEAKAADSSVTKGVALEARALIMDLEELVSRV